MKNIILILSLIFNLAMLAFFWDDLKRHRDSDTRSKAEAYYPEVDWEITSTKNFESVFIKKNDSIYKRLWNEAFENQPPSAFLISCTYFFVTKDTSVLNDIELSKEQLETMYNEKILVR